MEVLLIKVQYCWRKISENQNSDLNFFFKVSNLNTQEILYISRFLV